MPSEPVRLRGDATRLEQIFANLLNNAVKFTERDGEIGVTAVASLDEAAPARREVIVRVRDNGVGIAPDMLPRIFDLFAQADHSSARTQGGLGIGLNIVRSLVELHGGEVSAHSAGPSLGSEFVVRLPLQTAEKAAAEDDAAISRAAASLTANAGAGRRFLVVDDNSDIAESTAELLRMQGCTVQTATSGEEALRIARDFEPDFVLLDIGMPGLDGYAVARRIRARKGLQSAKLIAVSGYGTDKDRRRAKEADFDAHFTKPLDFDALAALVIRH